MRIHGDTQIVASAAIPRHKSVRWIQWPRTSYCDRDSLIHSYDPSRQPNCSPSRPAGYTTLYAPAASHAYGSADTYASPKQCSKTGSLSNDARAVIPSRGGDAIVQERQIRLGVP